MARYISVTAASFLSAAVLTFCAPPMPAPASVQQMGIQHEP